ncbi:UvrD-helicase domain-containing protein [Candidatus Falkowbacteria bacterium]|nr:UvrD-helicase domain-containing protein [Candidatus Falkowbacteria bacterium]
MEQLNPEQLKAVLHKEGPLLIVAGAGTGKTHLLTQKIGYIIEQGWAKSDQILALTFTEKAAGEMEERVDKLLPMGYLDLWINTFHGFAERIIKQHGLEIGLPTDFKLLNEFEQWILINKNLPRLNLKYYRPAGNPTKFIQALVRHFSRLKDEEIAPADYLAYVEELEQNFDKKLGGKAPAKAKKSKSKTGKLDGALKRFYEDLDLEEVSPEIIEQEVARLSEVANAYHTYQQLLLENGCLDFGDLINYCLKLFKERPLLLEQYRQQFKYILVDEFQDTNWAQYELVKLLAAPKNNLIVVGDDDQSIYAFRGASMSNILQFRSDYPKAEQVVLTENYRSRQNILDLAYEFIKLNNPNRLECQLNDGKDKSQCILSKQLKASNDGAGRIEVIRGSDLNNEIQQVLQKIVDIKADDETLGWNDFAVLVRANDTAKEFCAALDKQEIPYLFMASRGLYTKPVILDIISYLKLLDDYHESRALYRILNLPMFGFSHKEIVDLNFHAYKKSWSLFETMRQSGQLHLGAETDKKIYKVLTLLSSHVQMVRDKGATEIIIAFLTDSGYLAHLSKLPEQQAREQLGYLNQFAKRVQAFEANSDDRSVKSFLEEFNMELEAGESGSITPDLEYGPETVKVMTVHGSKGLEFKHVFIVGMVDKRFPAIERREAIAVPSALVKEIVPEGDTHLEEERRLFYVAITRARDGVYFSWAPDYGGLRKKKPSRFLPEAGLLDLKEMPNDDIVEVKKEKVPAAEGAKPAAYRSPNYFSYTQLAAFQNCPYQYYFAHILRIPMRGKGVFSFGSTMHNTLQKLFELVRERRGLGQGDLFGAAKVEENPTITWDEVNELYRESWIDDWYASKMQKEEYRAKGETILKEFYEQNKNDWPDNRYTETGFNLKVKANGVTCTVRGKIDRVDNIGGKLKIIDYKTGNPKDKLTFEEKEQLLIYQLAAVELFRDEVSSLAFHYLDNNTEQEFLGTPEELEKIQTKIVDTIVDIQKGQFPPCPSPLCKYCDFYQICEFRQG